MIRYPFSKAMSAASLTYAIYALVRPAHLGRALESTPQTKHDTTAQVFGVRDLVTSTVALASGDDSTVTAAMASRIAFDLGDCALIRRAAESDQAASKLTVITLGWAALNALALAVDRLTTR